MTNDNPGTRASLEQLADSLRTAPKYCNEHKPCDAKEHAESYKTAKKIFKYIFGVLAWGCVLMLAANVILADWLEVTSTLSYWQAIVGTSGLYGLAEIRKGL